MMLGAVLYQPPLPFGVDGLSVAVELGAFWSSVTVTDAIDDTLPETSYARTWIVFEPLPPLSRTGVPSGQSRHTVSPVTRHSTVERPDVGLPSTAGSATVMSHGTDAVVNTWLAVGETMLTVGLL